MEKPPLSKEKSNKSSIAKVLALSAMLFLTNPESKAQDAKNTEPLKENYPELIKEARKLNDSIYKKLLSLRGGGVAAIPPGTSISFNNYESNEAMMGYQVYFTPGNSEHPLSTYLVSDDDSTRIVYVDHNADGQLDKGYINKTTKSTLERDMDDLKIKNLPIEEIGSDGFAKTLMGKDITVFYISYFNGKYEVHVFDFKDGKKGNGTGESAKKFINGIQETYTNSLKIINKL